MNPDTLATASSGDDRFVDLFWKGYQLRDLQEQPDEHLLISLTAPATAICSACGRSCERIHEQVLRRVRDSDILDRRVSVELMVRRVDCGSCGVKSERIDWLDKGQRMTRRLVNWIEGLCRILPVKHVAKETGVSWHTVKRIDRRRLERELPSTDLSSIRRLVMDEFALHKGHRYASVIADADTRQVLWIGEGRTRLPVRPFFQQLGDHAGRIEAVAMDQNSAFDLEVKAHCPDAEVVYDLFHVVAKYGREVIDRVRVDQANRLREDKPARAAVKRSRWLLLKNRSNLSPGQQVKLDELMEANEVLATVYVLKEQLKEIWKAATPWLAYKLWKQWWKMARDSGIGPLIQFANKLKPYLRGILASSIHRLNTSVPEGMDNKIKVLKRMAYGYRDTDYFFLKIKHAFPGK